MAEFEDRPHAARGTRCHHVYVGMAMNPTGSLDLSVPDEPWMADAICRETDPEAFFPEKGGSTKEAKRICGLCGVREPCLAYALERGERFGIWGGLSERERRRLLRGAA
jgi:WhiB family transcriptional regulator, redox-sensing transcriptional regulator